jgi:hypothetical protein
VKQSLQLYKEPAGDALVLLARAAAHGLRLLHPLLLVDLPKQALMCISRLLRTFWDCCDIITLSNSTSRQHQHQHQQQQQQQELSACLQATGKFKQCARRILAVTLTQ